MEVDREVTFAEIIVDGSSNCDTRKDELGLLFLDSKVKGDFVSDGCNWLVFSVVSQPYCGVESDSVSKSRDSCGLSLHVSREPSSSQFLSLKLGAALAR